MLALFAINLHSFDRRCTNISGEQMELTANASRGGVTNSLMLDGKADGCSQMLLSRSAYGETICLQGTSHHTAIERIVLPTFLQIYNKKLYRHCVRHDFYTRGGALLKEPFLACIVHVKRNTMLT